MDISENRETESEPEVTEAQTLEQTDKKCPACGGTMDFDPKTGALQNARPPAGNENASAAAPSSPSAPPAVFPPLQAGMLSVMREHDEFIKRVKAKSGENKR